MTAIAPDVEMIALADRLQRRSVEIDNRLGPMPGQWSDQMAVDLRVVAGLLTRLAPEYVALLAVEQAARKLPRTTPACGGASTEHDYKIEAALAWNNDRALTQLDGVRASQSSGDR